MSNKLSAAALLGALASTVNAHGYVSGIVADGTYYQGYNPSFQYQSSPPAVVGWSDPADLGNGFVDPTAYASTNITCHIGPATAGQAVAKVAAGGKVEFQWTAWPSSHHGPVLTYIAKCANDDCTKETVDDLSFVKIDEAGLIDDTTVPGTWATDNLISNNNSYTVTIPDSLASGQYVLRHEIIALHSAGTLNGAQNYPQCVNVEVSGSGSATFTGEAATSFYKAADPGIEVNIYASIASYTIPGPALWTGASSTSQGNSTSGSSSAAAVVTSTPASSAAATSAAATSAAAVSSAAAVVSTPASSSAASSVAAVAVSSAASVETSAAAVVSQVDGFTTAIPSAILTSVLPSGTPTGVSNSTGSVPHKPLPQGFTLADLLEWVSYLVKNFYSGNQKVETKSRNHPRQFKASASGVFAPSGAKPTGGFAAPSGHHSKHHGHSGHAAPTGVKAADFSGFPSGVAKPSGHHSKHHGHSGHAAPTGGFGGHAHSSGFAAPTIARRAAPSGFAQQSGHGGKPSGGFPAPSGFRSGGHAHASGHAHHSGHGAGHAQPTGVKAAEFSGLPSGGFPAPTGGFGGFGGKAHPSGGFPAPSGGFAQASGHAHPSGHHTHSRGSARPTGVVRRAAAVESGHAKPSGGFPAPSGGFAQASGHAHPSGHHHHHSGQAQPTGAVAAAAFSAQPSGGFPKPSGGFAHHSGHHGGFPHPTGGAFPSGVVPSGGFPKPTGF